MRISTVYLCSLLFLAVQGSLLLYCHCHQDGADKSVPPPKRKLPKDPLFITDFDLEHLYDQWEEADDEKLPEDELPPHKRPLPKMELPKNGGTSELFKDPEKLLEATKKGKTVMAFANIAGGPTRDETETITQRWQVGLGNNHIKAERYVIADDRVIFVFQDGAQAFQAKDFILEQPECKEYSIDQRTWHGKGFPETCPATADGKCPRSNN